MTEVKKHLGEEKAKQTLGIRTTTSPYSTLFAQTIIFQVPLCLDTLALFLSPLGSKI